MTNKRLVIGVGNRMRRDDGAGPAVLDALHGTPETDVVEVAGDCARLIDLWDGRRDVVVVDATQSTAAPGTLVHLDAAAAPIPRDVFIHTSHAFGVAEAVETARALDRLPERLVVWGIEGADFGPGEGLSDSVAAAVAAVASHIAPRL